MMVKGTRRWLAISEDQILKLIVDGGRVEKVELGDPDVASPGEVVGKLWMLARKKIEAQGYEILPDGWSAPYITIKQCKPALPEDGDTAFVASVKASHPMGAELAVRASAETREKALRYFWMNWKEEVGMTEYHTHLDYNRKYKTC